MSERHKSNKAGSEQVGGQREGNAPRLAVLVSGSGSNLQAMIDASARGEFEAQIALVLSNRPEVKALERAKRAGLKSVVINHRDYDSRASFDEAMDASLQENGIEWIALAGFMRLLGPAFVRKWRGRLINIHPSLLPAFPGARALESALEAGAKQSGVSVHFVDEGTDTGPIIAQQAVPIFPGDTLTQLQARVQEVEHQLYPQVLNAVVSGKVWMEGRETRGEFEFVSAE